MTARDTTDGGQDPLLRIRQEDGAPRSRKRVLLARGATGALVVLAGVALFMPVEMSVTAPGRIVPSDRVKTVQHLEGGIIRSVLIREGQAVRAGDPLLHVDLGAAGLNLEEVAARLASLRAARARLSAEAAGRPLTDDDFDDGIPDTAARVELLTHRARLLEQQGQVDAARAQIDINTGRAAEIMAKSAGYRARQEILEREYAITSQLAKERLIPELEAVQRRKELEANRADLAGTQEGHRAALAAAQEARGKLAESEGRFRRRAAEELLAIERQIATTQEDHNRARNQRERTLVSAPITGFVKGLRSSEPGWVVKAGEPILDVVPGDAEIEVEARLSPSDRGLVLQGMPVRVKVTAYDFLRYGALDGDVRMIAADADHAEDKQSFFKMVVRTRGAVLGPAALPVTPGMQADVDVIVGHQPFAWYLVRPVLKIGAEAFREP